jgi:hypothetical protein
MAESEDRVPVRPETDRLLCDVMLGKLAVYLRFCGFDTAYAGDRGIETDDRIAATAEREGRRLCTRDVELADRVPGSILLTERDVEAQLSELREAGVELAAAEPPRYCGRCNGELVGIDPDAGTPEYAPEPSETDCFRCRACGQVFWRGSHYERMRETVGFESA